MLIHLILVEVRGVEPLSQHNQELTSTYVVHLFRFFVCWGIDGQIHFADYSLYESRLFPK